MKYFRGPKWVSVDKYISKIASKEFLPTVSECAHILRWYFEPYIYLPSWWSKIYIFHCKEIVFIYLTEMCDSTASRVRKKYYVTWGNAWFNRSIIIKNPWVFSFLLSNIFRLSLLKNWRWLLHIQVSLFVCFIYQWIVTRSLHKSRGILDLEIKSCFLEACRRWKCATATLKFLSREEGGDFKYFAKIF